MKPHLREQWRKLAVRIEVQSGSPLSYGYNITHRLVARGQAAPSEHPYFKDLDDDIVGFGDVAVRGDTVYIAYITVRDDVGGQGIASALVRSIYDQWPSKDVHWGELHHGAMRHLYQKYRELEPERTWGGKFR